MDLVIRRLVLPKAICPTTGELPGVLRISSKREVFRRFEVREGVAQRVIRVTRPGLLLQADVRDIRPVEYGSLPLQPQVETPRVQVV